MKKQFLFKNIFIILYWGCLINTLNAETYTWDRYLGRCNIQALSISHDNTVLWVGTTGGLEERDIISGKLKAVYTKIEGLPEDQISTGALATDKKGGVWIGTEKGLAYLDSNRNIRTYSTGLPYDSVLSLFVDDFDGLWIGTWGKGLSYLSPKGLWENFNTDNSKLSGNIIDKLSGDGSGGIWIGTDNGLDHLKSDVQLRNFNNDECIPDAQILSLIGEKSGSAWVGLLTYGVTHIMSDESCDIYDLKSLFQFDYNRVTSLSSDKNGGLWVGTQGNGLLYLDKNKNGEFYNTNNSLLPFDNVLSLIMDQSNNLWIGTGGYFPYMGGDGLARLKESGEWDLFNRDNYYFLYGSGRKSIVNDHNGGVWIGIGLSNEIIHMKNDKSIIQYKAVDLSIAENSLYCMTIDDENYIWIGTWIGEIVRFNSVKTDEIIKFNNPELSIGSVCKIVGDGNGGVWLGTSGLGLFHMNREGKWENYNSDTSDLPSNFIGALVIDSNDGVWVGTGKGLAHLKSNDDWNIFTVNNSVLPSNDVISLSLDNSGGIWVSTYYGFSHLKSDGSWEYYSEENSGLINNYTGILLNDGADGVWIGTPDGVSHFRSDGKWENYTTDNSYLPENSILSLTADGEGGIWIETYNGLTHLILSSQSNPSSPTLNVSVEGTAATFTWNSVENAIGYNFCFDLAQPNVEFDGEFIDCLDVGSLSGTTTLNLWSGAGFHIGIQSYDDNGTIETSNVETFFITE